MCPVLGWNSQERAKKPGCSQLWGRMVGELLSIPLPRKGSDAPMSWVGVVGYNTAQAELKCNQIWDGAIKWLNIMGWDTTCCDIAKYIRPERGQFCGGTEENNTPLWGLKCTQFWGGMSEYNAPPQPTNDAKNVMDVGNEDDKQVDSCQQGHSHGHMAPPAETPLWEQQLQHSQTDLWGQGGGGGGGSVRQPALVGNR